MNVRPHLKRLAAALVISAVGTSGVVALAQVPAAAAVTCVNDCINPVTITTTHNSAKFVFSTTVPTKARAQIFSGTTKITEVAPATTFKSSYAITTPAALAANTSYTWKLRVVDQANVLRVETGTLKTKLAGCAVNCLTGVSPERKPAQVSVRMFTSVPTKATMTVTQNGVFKAIAADTVFSTTKTLKTANVLQPGNTYTLTTKFTDQNGKVFTHTMQYQTAVRRVTVYLEDVFMIDDSDPNGSGEFYAAARLNGVERLLTYRVDLASGWTYSPKVTMTSLNAPETSTFQVRMSDEDCVGICEFGLPDSWNSQETDEYSWATATLSIVDPGNWLATGPVGFDTDVRADVAFSIDGWYSIDYV